MAEAVTLSPRIAFRVPGFANEIVAGRRADGRWSLFFDGDPAYHFDSENCLRRAFVSGLLYRSQGSTLARLTRQESDKETVLLRHDLTSDELDLFLQQLRQNLQAIADALSEGTVNLLNKIPEEADYLPQLGVSIERVLTTKQPLAPAIKR